MNSTLKKLIFLSLDQRIGRDLIVAVHEIKAIYSLSDHEFYPIFIEWQKTKGG